jgi:hypothetical protein
MMADPKETTSTGGRTPNSRNETHLGPPSERHPNIQRGTKTEMVKTFTTAFIEAVEVMNMGVNETLMKAIFMSKLRAVARTWKQCVERGKPAEVPRTNM